MRLISTLLLLTSLSACSLPFRYQFRPIEGNVYQHDGTPMHVRFKGPKRLQISGCEDARLDTFLRTLPLVKHGRKQLKYLLTSSAKVRLIISDQMGIMYKDGKYGLIAGSSGPDKDQSEWLISNNASISTWTLLFNRKKPVMVYDENTIEIFKGSTTFYLDSTPAWTKANIRLFNWHTNEEITEFSLDSIELAPIRYPDLLYRNIRELYYFAGLHEIYHTRPENIEIHEDGGNAEGPAIAYEMKAFRKRKRINRRQIRWPKPR